MACRSTGQSLLCVLGLLLTPTTPLAQALPCRAVKQRSCTSLSAASSCCPSHRAFGSSRPIPWWWCRLRRKRVLDDVAGVPIEARLWQSSRRAGVLSVEVLRGLSVPVRCVICTAWFGALCLQKLLVLLVGPDEMRIWIDVAHAWTDGAQQFFVVFSASLRCAEMMTVRVAHFALADVLPGPAL